MANSLAVAGRLTSVTISGWPFSENYISEHEITEWETMPIRRGEINASYYRANPYASTIAGTSGPIVFNWTMNYIPYAYDIYKASCDGTYDIKDPTNHPVQARLTYFSIMTSSNSLNNYGTLDFSGYIGSVSPTFPMEDKTVFRASIMVDGYVQHASLT